MVTDTSLATRCSTPLFCRTGGNAFTITGAPIAEDTGLPEAGFNAKLSKLTTLGVSYTGQFGSDVRFSVKF